MDDATIDQDQADEETLAHEVSDDALEAAAGNANGVAAVPVPPYTPLYFLAANTESIAGLKPGRGLISRQPNADWCELDEDQIVGRELVISGLRHADGAPHDISSLCDAPSPGGRCRLANGDRYGDRLQTSRRIAGQQGFRLSAGHLNPTNQQGHSP